MEVLSQIITKQKIKYGFERNCDTRHQKTKLVACKYLVIKIESIDKALIGKKSMS